ncbi:autotransporter domain-containing protein, partial [Reyranella sp. CPCC 100927]|uniref:autotransporter domain-containing protein n=1 Tax=Reyranella sp. CPCC 100927 TaxID=2599616 RepID=UPI0011B4D481
TALGGAGGTTPGAAGAAGADAVSGYAPSGGGGGGGAHGFVGPALPNASSTGGAGGAGGGSTVDLTEGGSGGAGGFGAVVTSSGDLGTMTVSATGGAGGNGGSADFVGGNGGSGGIGLLLTSTAGTTLTVAGTIQGGKGGSGGDATFDGDGSNGGAGIVGQNLIITLSATASVTGGDGGSSQYGSVGVGGAGIVGQNLAITLDGGRIVGGLSGASVRGNAIAFTGGTNTLTITRADSTLTGNIDVTGSLTIDQRSGFALGGAITGSGSVTVSGTGTLVLTGDSTYAGVTTISAGTLQLGDGGGSGSIGGNVVNNAALVFNRSGTATPFGQFPRIMFDGVISGTGTVTQAGTGTLILTADNTYGGGTTISAGTLQLGNAGTTGGIVGNVTNNATLAFNRTDSITFSGVISGTGAVRQIGSGTTILTGDNTYGGGTIISTGTLQVGNGTNTGSITGNVSNNATLVFNRSDTVTFAGVISGNGALQQNGGGATVLTGNNVYTGGTVISTGTLQLGTGGTTGSILGNVANDGTLIFNRSDTLTFGGTISGTGSVRQIGGGVLTLTGSNAYGGGTTVSGGTLSVSSNANLGAAGSRVTLSDGGTLRITGTGYSSGRVFDLTASGGAIDVAAAAGNFVAMGAIGGPGGLTKKGAGTLTLTAEATYGGSTIIAAGTLQLGNGGTTGAITGNVTNNATLAFNRSDTVTFAGIISGSGALHQVGGGTTILTGNSGAFAGSTTVSDGTLRVDSTLGGSVSVLTGGTLAGTGSIAGPVTVDGTLSVGASPGTLSVGSLALNAGATSIFELNAPGVAGGSDPVTGNDLVVVSGNLTLGGALDARAAAGGYYRLFNYGGTLAGAFSGVGVTGTSGFTVAGHQVETGITGQVNLAVRGAGQTLFFWDGADSSGNGTVDGRAGTWSAGGTNWTGQPGQAAINGTWGGSVGIFAGAAGGTVTVVGTQAFDTLQFSTAGYALSGGTLAMSPASGTAGTITVDSGVAASIASTIADGTATGLRKVGSGTLILTGNNTYSGGTTISGGTLQLGDGGTSGAITGDVVNDRTLAFNRSDSVTFAGVISGSGAVRQIGNGTTVLTGANTYSGGTTIAAGTLAGSAASFGSGTILNNGALIIDQAADAILANAIDGTGSLAKRGAGTLNLTGTSTLSGLTTVEAGRLVVNGSLANSVVTLSGGTLSGTGTIGGVVIQSGAIVAPGNSTGTLTVAGNVAFAAGSTYQVEVDAAGATDRILATGTATLAGGTVQVLAAPGSYAPATQYTILTAAGGVSGQFAGVSSNLAFLTPSLGYDASNAYLTLQRNDIRFAGIGMTPNQVAAAGGVETLGLGNPLYGAIVPLDAASARMAFEGLSGEIHASLKATLLEDSRFIREATLDRLRQAFGGVSPSGRTAAASDTVTAWMRGFGSWSTFTSDGNAGRLNRSASGVIVGADAAIGDVVRLGLAAGYSNSRVTLGARASSARIDSYHLALYGGAQFGGFGVRAGAAYAWHDIDTSRTIAFPGFTDRARDTYSARTAQIYGEVGYTVDAGPVVLEPFANLAYVNLRTNGTRESGGAAALRGRGGTSDATFSTLGARATAGFDVGNGHRLTVHATAGWRHAFGGVRPKAVQAVAGGPDFTISGVPLARNAIVIDTGVDISLTQQVTFGVRYNGQLGAGARDHGIRANLTVTF